MWRPKFFFALDNAFDQQNSRLSVQQHLVDRRTLVPEQTNALGLFFLFVFVLAHEQDISVPEAKTATFREACMFYLFMACD